MGGDTGVQGSLNLSCVQRADIGNFHETSVRVTWESLSLLGLTLQTTECGSHGGRLAGSILRGGSGSIVVPISVG